MVKIMSQTYVKIFVYSSISSIYELPHELLNDLRLRILGSEEMSGKLHNFIELLPSAHSSSQSENFVSASKNFVQNRN